MQGKKNNICISCQTPIHWNNDKVRIVKEIYEPSCTNKDRKGKVTFVNLAQYHKECYKEDGNTKTESNSGSIEEIS
jgi:hypothetical protein